MEASKLQIKFYAKASDGFSIETLVPVFHGWIRERVLDELLIDVVDYSHVHNGPGVVLLGHASDYYLDQTEGRLGLLYSRKREAPAEPRQRLADAFRRALNGCRLLAREPALSGKLHFAANEALVRVNDRLRAPNTPEAYEALEALVTPLAIEVFGAGVEMTRAGTDKDLLSLRIQAPAAPDVAALLDRLGGPISATS